MSIQRLDHVNFLTHNPKATVKFYCDVIGLELVDPLAIDAGKTLYFSIKGMSMAVLHVGQVATQPDSRVFSRLSQLDPENEGCFSTGAFDHFCLSVDDNDYTMYIDRFERRGIPYQVYHHADMPMKQIWVLDPNGVRVELSFLQ